MYVHYGHVVFYVVQLYVMLMLGPCFIPEMQPSLQPHWIANPASIHVHY